MKKWKRTERIVAQHFDATQMISWERQYTKNIEVKLVGGGYGTTATIDFYSHHLFISKYFHPWLLCMAEGLFNLLEQLHEEAHRHDDEDPNQWGNYA